MNDKNTPREISIGVGAVIFRGDEVLLIKRGKEPFQGQWSIPGGRLEFGETVIHGIHREVMEETSIEIDLIGLIDVFDAIPPIENDSPQSHMVLIDYLGLWKSGEPMAGDDAKEAEFVSIDEALRRLSWDVTRQAIRRAVAMRDSFQAKP